jgi:hypothetical protein
LYNQAFKIEDSLKLDAIFDAVVSKKPEIPSEVNPQKVLFNNYSKECEPYYLERNIDKEFINSLKLNNLWVFGDSGFGKTALVNRNLTKNDIEYCFCDLSPINIISSGQVIEEIIFKMEEKFQVERDTTFTNNIKQLTHLLCCAKKKKIIIVIDELSVKDDKILKDIASDLINLVVHYSNSSKNEELKFVVSTISNPKDIIDNISKASQHFQYIDCNNWNDNIEKLFDILTSSLNIDLEAHKKHIFESCENSPRILKSIIRKIIALDNTNPEAIVNAIKITTSELVR